MPKFRQMLYIFFCCQCTSCILWDEIQSGTLDSNEKIKEREIELKKRFQTKNKDLKIKNRN